MEVRNGSRGSSSVVNGYHTMDDLYTLALNDSCKVTIDWKPNSPVIGKYYSDCGEEGSGFEIVEFYGGRQVKY